MPVIRISDATWARLKQHAVPLEDTPERVINKALDALDAKNPLAEQKPAITVAPIERCHVRPLKRRFGTKLPQKEFRMPLMEVVYELGGEATTDRVRDSLEKKMAPKLGPDDYNKVTNGDPRWWNAICWERSDLVREGLFRKGSPHGTWELTPEGVKLVESTQSK